MKLLVVFLLFNLVSLSVWADHSNITEIDRVQFNAESGSYFAFKSDGWGVCDNNQYVQLRGNTSNSDKFASQVLAAFMAGKKVRFSGTCTNANGYLDATYIIVYN